MEPRPSCLSPDCTSTQQDLTRRSGSSDPAVVLASVEVTRGGDNDITSPILRSSAPFTHLPMSGGYMLTNALVVTSKDVGSPIPPGVSLPPQLPAPLARNAYLSPQLHPRHPSFPSCAYLPGTSLDSPSRLVIRDAGMSTTLHKQELSPPFMDSQEGARLYGQGVSESQASMTSVCAVDTACQVSLFHVPLQLDQGLFSEMWKEPYHTPVLSSPTCGTPFQFVPISHAPRVRDETAHSTSDVVQFLTNHRADQTVRPPETAWYELQQGSSPTVLRPDHPPAIPQGQHKPPHTEAQHEKIGLPYSHSLGLTQHDIHFLYPPGSETMGRLARADMGIHCPFSSIPVSAPNRTDPLPFPRPHITKFGAAVSSRPLVPNLYHHGSVPSTVHGPNQDEGVRAGLSQFGGLTPHWNGLAEPRAVPDPKAEELAPAVSGLDSSSSLFAWESPSNQEKFPRDRKRARIRRARSSRAGVEPHAGPRCESVDSFENFSFRRVGKIHTRNGCWTCRERKKKCPLRCDERGRCAECVRLGYICLAGYGKPRPPGAASRKSRRAGTQSGQIRPSICALPKPPSDNSMASDGSVSKILPRSPQAIALNASSLASINIILASPSPAPIHISSWELWDDSTCPSPTCTSTTDIPPVPTDSTVSPTLSLASLGSNPPSPLHAHEGHPEVVEFPALPPGAGAEQSAMSFLMPPSRVQSMRMRGRSTHNPPPNPHQL
ncbi:hypothetical protein DL93DRAFT_2225838 [Clavulina sp. PMI_390]|nr:hypothetical protein DL93DRAFT_2225838 [Clavulina sp. PMI_390]